MNNTYLIKLLGEIKEIMTENRDYLIQLDSIVGDGDLGLTMSDGYLAAYNAVTDGQETDAGKLLYMAGKAMSITVPSTMGTLMASGFMQAGKVLRGKTELNDQDIIALFTAYMDGVMNRGKAEIGDKTFLDGLNPALIVLKEKIAAGDSLQSAAIAAAEAAAEGFENTATMIAVHGRAATRGEQSRNLKDPGAAVAMFLMRAFAKSVSG